MNKYPFLIGVSICAVVLLILASLTNVVGYQTITSSNQKTSSEVINQKELLFQSIVDIANNKEIRGILLRYQISTGEFPVSHTPVLTMKQLKQMYIVGLILTKTISKARMYSIIETYQVNNQGMQKEIIASIEKYANLNREIKQLSDSKCNCDNNSESTTWQFPVICTLIFVTAVIFLFLIWSINIGYNMVIVLERLYQNFHCGDWNIVN